MGAICCTTSKHRNLEAPLQVLLKSKPLTSLLDMWSSSYLQMLKQKFLAFCSQNMDHGKFRQLFPLLKSQRTSIRIFECFDFDRNGRMDFREFCIMLSLFFNSEDSDRMELLFGFYDFDQDGHLSIQEVEFFVQENKQYIYRDIPTEDMDLQEFKKWIDQNFNLTRYYEIFELIPGPLKERERIREILISKNQHQTYYVVSYKWWELWRFYINDNFKNLKKQNHESKVPENSLIDYNMEELQEEKVKVQTLDDQGVQGSQVEDNNNNDPNNPKWDLNHGICESFHEILLGDDIKQLLRPGQIDNSDISGEYDGELKLNILNNHDYVIIPEAAWLLLVQWYGCYNNLQYKRHSFQDERRNTQIIDLYPPLLQGFITTLKGEVQFKKSFIFMVSLRKSMNDVFNKLVKKFKIKNSQTFQLYYMKINEEWKAIEDLEQKLVDLQINSGTFVTLGPKNIIPKSQLFQLQLGQLYDVQHPLTNEWLLCVLINFSEDFQKILFHPQRENHSRDFKILIQDRSLRVYPPHSKQKQEQHILLIPNVTGLFNLGNTCFINTVTQCLINTPIFDQYLVKQSYKLEIQKQGKVLPLIEELSKVAFRLNETQKVISPEQFKKAIDQNLPQFSGYEQHDAQEFLNILLDTISDEIKKNLPKKANISVNNSFEQFETVIKELFMGKTVNTIVCQNCQNKSQRIEEYYTLSLPIPLNDEINIVVVFFRRVIQGQNIPPLLKYGVKVSKYGTLKDLYQAIEKITGIQMQRFEVAEIYRNSIHKQFANYDSKTPIRQIGLKANQVLHAFEIAKIIKEAEDEFQDLITLINQRKDNFSKGDYIDIEDRQGEWKHGQIISIVDRNMEKSYKVQIKKQNNTQQNIFTCHQFQLQPFRSKVSLQKLKFNLTTVINRVYNQGLEQFEKFSIPFLLIVPTQHLTWMEFQLLIYTQAKRFIDFDYIKKKRQFSKIQRESRQLYNLNQELHHHHDLFLKKQNIQSVHLWHRKTEQDIEEQSRLCGPSYQSANEELAFLRESDFPYKIKILDSQNMNCLSCEKPVFSNRYGTCSGCEVDPMFLNLPQNYNIVLDWSDSLAFNLLSVKAQSHQSYLEMIDTKRDRVTPEQCFQILTQEEKVEINCDKCQSTQPSIVKFSLGHTPNILILHLKRFQYKDGFLEKIESDIDFPLRSLNLKDWSISQTKDKVYDLYAVANHFGNGQYGHYTAYILRNIDGKEHWIHCDDDQIKHHTQEKVISQYAYLLFYRKREIPTSSLLNLTYKN